jgi:hypothetical protein
MVGRKNERARGRDVFETPDLDATVKDVHQSPGKRKKKAVGHGDHE